VVHETGARCLGRSYGRAAPTRSCDEARRAASASPDVMVISLHLGPKSQHWVQAEPRNGFNAQMFGAKQQVPGRGNRD
jgi:hypothetical protein